VSATTDARIRFDGGEVASPGLRTTARRAVFWIVMVLILLLVAAVTFATVGAAPSAARLSATNPGPTGAEALVSVLREDGVTVHAPRTLTTAMKDVALAPTTTTVVLYDPTNILTRAQLRTVAASASNLILIQPSTPALDIFAAGVSPAGYVASTKAAADCDYPPVQRARSVAGLQKGYRITGQESNEQGCLGHDSVYSLVRVTETTHTVSVLGSTTILTNQSIPLAGNAALALGLFGSTSHLVWYRPSVADAASVTPDGVIPNPPWVILAIILAGLVVVAAGIWRGRRLGPVVVERMPVVVRSSETLEGRARLYQRASARSHALDALRIGTISRLAVLCGLPTLASVDEVIGAVAVATGRSIDSLRGLLLDTAPSSDLQLVRLSDELEELEAAVRDAVVPR